MKSFAIAALFLFVVSPSARSQHNGALLEWNQYYELVWEDFQGKPGPHAIGDAGTAVHIKAKPYYVGDKLHYDVIAYFNREKSWMRDKSDALLAHEQLHFQIAELYARKIRKRISEMSRAGEDDPEIFNAAIRELLQASNEADQQYDLETLHGAMVKRQKAWQAKVESEMEELSAFSRTRRILGVKKLKKQPHIFSRRRSSAQ